MSEHFYVYPHVSSLFLDGVLYDYTGSEIVHHVMVNGAFLKTCSASRSTKCAVADAGILLEISSSQVQSLQRGVSPGSTLIACSFSDAGMSSCIATKLSSSTGVIILESINEANASGRVVLKAQCQLTGPEAHVHANVANDNNRGVAAIFRTAHMSWFEECSTAFMQIPLSAMLNASSIDSGFSLIKSIECVHAKYAMCGRGADEATFVSTSDMKSSFISTLGCNLNGIQSSNISHMQTDKPASKIITIEQEKLKTLILNDVQNNNALDVDMISELCQAIRLSNKTQIGRAHV